LLAGYRTELDTKVKINADIKAPQELETEVSELTKAIQFARGQVGKKIKITRKEDNLPQDIIDLIKYKNRLRKTWQRTRNIQDAQEITRLQQTIRTNIQKHKDNAWADTLRGLSTTDNFLWRLTRKLKNKEDSIPSLQTNTPQTNRQKADMLATNYANASSGVPNAKDSKISPIV